MDLYKEKSKKSIRAVAIGIVNIKDKNYNENKCKKALEEGIENILKEKSILLCFKKNEDENKDNIEPKIEKALDLEYKDGEFLILKYRLWITSYTHISLS